ncbi:MAG: hypothetical protein EHM20_07615 [Alphaproteobacteria bacterium]|nr:MAG: hypothetical protein EHM20_07615 [Alphaproteobacteria bacterium]
MNTRNLLKNHVDTLAIVGVNIAHIAIMLTLWISANARIDAVNARMDSNIALIQQEFKEFQSFAKDFHGRLCVIEERNSK